MIQNQLIKANSKYIKISPHKVRRILKQINGCSYQEALLILRFLPYNAVKPIWKVLCSAAANAKYNYGLNKKNLIIHKIFANEGPKLKRSRIRARGKIDKILKPTCHIHVIVKENIKK